MYFDKLISVEDIKERYRTLAKRLHPDTGGDKEIMQEINNEYEKALGRVKGPKKLAPGVMSVREKLNMITKWADSNLWFDMDFIESLKDQIAFKKTLTFNQEKALNKIIKKFNIEESYD